MREKEFERMYLEHANPLLNFLLYRLGDRALAEDLLADSFEKAYRARRRFDRSRANEKTWLYTIALNCVRDHVRRVAAEERAIQRTLGSESATASAGSGPLETRIDLLAALEGLTEAERTAIALRYGADLAIAQIADLLDEPLTTVDGRIQRGLRKLRRSPP